jgi:hypothetical protein
VFKRHSFLENDFNADNAKVFASMNSGSKCLVGAAGLLQKYKQAATYV